MIYCTAASIAEYTSMPICAIAASKSSFFPAALASLHGNDTV